MDLMHNEREPTLTDVLLALKDNVFASLHVAEICQITQVNSDGSYVCKRVGSSILYNCFALKNLSLHVDDVVLVLFTDHNYAENLIRLDNGLDLIGESQSQLFHTVNNGIIIGTLN